MISILTLLNISIFAKSLVQGSPKVELKVEREFLNPSNSVYGFSLDSKVLAVSQSQHRIDLWDTNSMRFRGSLFTGPTDISPFSSETGIRGIEFSRDGNRIFVTELIRNEKGFFYQDTCKLYEFSLATNTLISSSNLKVPNHTSILLSPNGEMILIPCVDSVYIYELATKNLFSFEVKAPDGLPGLVRICKLSNDGSSIYASTGKSANSGSLIFEYDVATHKVVRTFDQRFNSNLHFNSAGRELYVPNIYGYISKWDRSTGMKLSTFTTPKMEGIWSSVYLKNTDSLLLGCTSSLLLFRLSDTKFGNPIFISKNSNEIKSVSISPNNKIAAASTDSGVVFVDMLTNAVKGLSEGYAIKSEQVEFLSDDLAISKDKYQSVKVWDVNSGKLKLALTGGTGNVRCGTFSPDGDTLFAAGDDGIIRICDVSKGVIKDSISNGAGIVAAMSISVDGNLLAVGDSNGKLRIYNLSTKSEIFNFDKYVVPIRALDFSANGKHLAIGFESGRVVTFELPSLKVMTDVEVSKELLFALCFLSDSNEFVISGSDAKLRVINAVSGKIVRSQEQTYGENVLGIDLSRDGKYIVTANSDKTIRIFDAEGLMERQKFELPDIADSVAFMGDTDELVCTCRDGNIRIFQIGKNQMKVALTSQLRIPLYVTVSRDGKRLAYFGQRGSQVVSINRVE